jgi:DNA-binding MarR family transcriptional regulator
MSLEQHHISGEHQATGETEGDSKRDERVRVIIQQLRLVVRGIQKHSRWIEAQSGVSGAQLWAMWELFTAPGMRVSDLSRTLSIHQSTCSNMLDKLEDKGLVRRERGGPDQRVVRIYLTPQGTDILAGAPRPAQGMLTHALHKLSDESQEQLARTLGELVSVMDIGEEAAALQPLMDT